MIHTDEKPYACDICEMAFTERGGLAKHKRIHTGVEHYECEICKNAFSDFSSWTKHKWIRTGESHMNVIFVKISLPREMS